MEHGADLLVRVVSRLLLSWITRRWEYWASRGWRAWWEDRWPDLNYVLLGGTIVLLLQAVAQYSGLYLIMGPLILCLALVHLVCLIVRDMRKQPIPGS